MALLMLNHVRGIGTLEVALVALIRFLPGMSAAVNDHLAFIAGTLATDLALDGLLSGVDTLVDGQLPLGGEFFGAVPTKVLTVLGMGQSMTHELVRIGERVVVLSGTPMPVADWLGFERAPRIIGRSAVLGAQMVL
ncbi:MAG: hypothetical protein Q9228_007380 [Teloschistes exilis]